MIIVNKNRNEAFNMEHIQNIYINEATYSIKVVVGALGRSSGALIGEYNSSEKNKVAFELLMEKIERATKEAVIYAPTDEEVETRIKTRPQQQYHHIKGNKTKGHGGS